MSLPPAPNSQSHLPPSETTSLYIDTTITIITEIPTRGSISYHRVDIICNLSPLRSPLWMSQMVLISDPSATWTVCHQWCPVSTAGSHPSPNLLPRRFHQPRYDLPPSDPHPYRLLRFARGDGPPFDIKPRWQARAKTPMRTAWLQMNRATQRYPSARPTSSLPR